MGAEQSTANGAPALAAVTSGGAAAAMPPPPLRTPTDPGTASTPSPSGSATSPTLPILTMKAKTLVVCGPSGVGKGTLINLLMDENKGLFGFSVSHTTRKPREGEQDGVHYHFTTHEEMEKGIAAGKFLEHANVHGNYYGTSTDAVATVVASGKVCILDIDVQGARAVRAANLDAVFVFVLPPSMETLEQRLRSRGTEKEEAVVKRMKNAVGEIEAATEPGLFQHVICNSDLQSSYQKFGAIALAATKGESVPHVVEHMAPPPPPPPTSTPSTSASDPSASASASSSTPPATGGAAAIPGLLAAWRDRCVVVTGASSGIGRELASELARGGARVVAAARRVERLEKLAADLAAAGVPADRLLPAQVDITKEDQVQGIAGMIRHKWGPRAGIDALINCASVGRSNGSLMDGDSMMWLEMLDTNVLGLCMCTREAVKDMRARSASGHIIHLSSLSAHRCAGPGSTFHGATKAAVRSLCEGLRQEVVAAGLPIRVSMVSPGLCETEVAMVGGAQQGSGGKSACLQSEDVVHAILFALTSPHRMEINDIIVRPTGQKH